MSVSRVNLLWEIGTGKSVPFTGFLTKLFKRHGIHIPMDLIGIEPEKPIDRYSLKRSAGAEKKAEFEGDCIGGTIG